MFKQITPVFLPVQRTRMAKKLRPFFQFFLLAIASIWLLGLQARPAFFSVETPEAFFPGDTLIEAEICAGDTYPFDGQLLGDPGTYNATYTASDGSDSIVTLQLSVLPISQTDLDVTICAGETYDFNGETLSQSGEYVATLIAENGCDSIVRLQLNVLPPIVTNLDAAICEGYYYVFLGDTLTIAGNYAKVLTAGNGCDSIVRLNLQVVGFFETNLVATICSDDFYVFGSDTLFADGVYVDSLTAQSGGCDSIVTLNLFVLPNISTNVAVQLCVGASYIFQGDTLTEDGIYVEILDAANGCDSVIVLDLTFVTSFETTLEQTICAGDTYVFGNDTLDTEGTYSLTLTASGGCDSIVTLQLSVLPGATGAEEATICEGETFEYNGESLTNAGNYTFVLEDENGCDSIVTLTLNVLPASESAIAATICNGETYPFFGLELDNSGVFEAILTAENGCDSLITLTLTVLPAPEVTLEATICAGETYDYNGELLSDAGAYTFVYTAENGCDSTVNLNLLVLPVQSTTLNVNICEGEAYLFDGILLTVAGTYSASLTGENGCDSTVTLVLGILPVQNTAVEATICDNETYEFDGENLSAAGTYTALLTGENGCDSTVVLTLNVLPSQGSNIEASICEGEIYPYAGAALDSSGVYEFVFQTENGCDSIVTLTLTILPNAATALTATICAGDTYDYNGELLSDAGDYTFEYQAENGCDSVVTLTLQVLPAAATTLAAALCEGASYVYGDDTLSVSGFYTYTFTAENGCDSTVTLVLEFVGGFETNLTAAICDGESYVFGNDTLTLSGQYSQLLSAAGGCDSLVNLTLDVLPHVENALNVAICAGASYDFNGQILTETGSYTAVLTAENGCDSTVVLSLTVLPTQTTELSASTCANEPYQFNGLALSDPGVYSVVLTGANGCDSTVVLTLSVLPVSGSELTADICANEFYNFGGEILSQEGVYQLNLPAENGCDSIVTLTLTVRPLAETAFAASVCNGESFEYNGTVLTESGEYQFVYEGAAANGCDSIETLFLTIFPAIPPTEISAAICAGESYEYNGQTLTVPGTYTFELASSVGCDSVVLLTLIGLPDVFTEISAGICDGESYDFDGQILVESGIYTAVYTAANGCDSTVVLSLTVNTVNTNVTLDGATLTAAAVGATYQWINCAGNQPIPGATGASYTADATGNYAVIVTQNGCTATSTCVFVEVVAAYEPLQFGAWTVQPNPAVSSASILFDEATTEEMELTVLDMTGRWLSRQQVAIGTRTLLLDLTDMPDGVLILRLEHEQGVASKRLVKAAR
ncbi:MAG: T9SS type A sorting domain-containing protein [Saprospiraceae bacterium]|nr:T9SS type A sorting domain-containing protein [Saprospiraceae bacterium]